MGDVHYQDALLPNCWTRLIFPGEIGHSATTPLPTEFCSERICTER